MLNEIPNKHREQTSETTAHIPHLNTEQEMYVKKVPTYRRSRGSISELQKMYMLVVNVKTSTVK